MADAARITQLPVLNLLARPLLLGLCRRALAPSADQGQAPLTARRIEHARLAQTELLKRISSLKADVGILQGKALDAQRTAQQSALDLQLFAERNPPPPKRQGLFAPKPGPAEKETELQRQRAHSLAQLAQASAQQAQARAEAASRELLQAESALAVLRQERGSHELSLRDEVGAWVLELAAQGQADAARLALADLRRNIRGDVVIGVLCVLTELFCAGPEEVRQALGDASPIFEQHRDPAVRVLEALCALAYAGEQQVAGPPALQLSESATGLYLREQFTQPGLYRLYTLVRILGGLGYDAEAVAHDPLRLTYAALARYRDASTGGTAVETESPATPLEAGAGPVPPPDAVLHLLQANLLLRSGDSSAVCALAGFDITGWQPPRNKRQSQPTLWERVTALPLPAWPAPLTAGLHAALACHALLAVHASGPPELAQAWLNESYGWPKDDFYWWTLSRIQDAPALLRNITGAPGQLCCVPPPA